MARTRASGVRVAVLVGGVLLLALLFALGPGRILSLLSALGGNFLVIVALFGCHELVRAAAIDRCLYSHQRPGFRRLLRIRFLGEAAGTLTRIGPFAAEPMRAWMLGDQAGRGPEAYAAALSELIANSATSASVTVVVAGFVLVARAIHGELLVLAHVLFWSSLVYVGVAIWAVASRVSIIGAVARALGGLPFVGHRLRTDPVRVRRMEDAIVHALTHRPVALAQVLLLECVAQSILVFEMYWTIRSMGVDINLGTALFVEVLTKAANVVQFIGVTEGAYAVVFNWLGMTAAVGFTLSLVKLLRSLIAAGLGLAILVPGGCRRESAEIGAAALERS